MMQKSSELFPARHEFHKINDGHIGLMSRRQRGTSIKARLTGSISTRGSAAAIISPTDSPTSSHKKAVRLMFNDNDGNVVIDTPTQFEKEKAVIRPLMYQST